LTDEPGQGSSALMNDSPDNASPKHDGPEDDRDAVRRKLMGRAMLVGFLLLVAIYALFTWLGRR